MYIHIIQEMVQGHNRKIRRGKILYLMRKCLQKMLYFPFRGRQTEKNHV